MPEVDEQIIIKAVDIILDSGQHHAVKYKIWALDQVLRLLCQDDYAFVIKQAFGSEAEGDPDGTQYWSCGTEPYRL